MTEPFFYEDIPAEERPYCPPLRHDDDPEPFFRDGVPLYFKDGRIVDEDGKPTYWFRDPSKPGWASPLKPQPTFASAYDAAFTLFLNNDAWYMGHAYLKFDDWRKYADTNIAG